MLTRFADSHRNFYLEQHYRPREVAMHRTCLVIMDLTTEQLVQHCSMIGCSIEDLLPTFNRMESAYTLYVIRGCCWVSIFAYLLSKAL